MCKMSHIEPLNTVLYGTIVVIIKRNQNWQHVECLAPIAGSILDPVPGWQNISDSLSSDYNKSLIKPFFFLFVKKHSGSRHLILGRLNISAVAN